MATSIGTSSDDNYQQYVLRKNEKKIANLINLTCLLPVLRDKGLLTENEFQQISSVDSSENMKGTQSRQLVQIMLQKKEGNVLDIFIEALREDEEHVGHKSLAFELLAELSNPPSPLRPRASTLPQNTVRSEIKRQSLPKHTSLGTRSFSVSETSASRFSSVMVCFSIDS